jgi:predicted RecB family endonuclease
LEEHRERPRVDSAKILNELEQSGSISGRRFEEIVSSILQQAGAASVENERYGPDHGVDIVIAPSDNSGSVILVEAKSGRLDEHRLREAEEELQSYVINRQAGLGLVIYHDSLGRQFPQHQPTPLTVRLSIEELVRQLETRSLTRVISDATNAAIDQM